MILHFFYWLFLVMFYLWKVLNCSRSRAPSPISQSSSMPSLIAALLERLMRPRRMLLLRLVWLNTVALGSAHVLANTWIICHIWFTGTWKVWVQSPDHPLPRWWVSVPSHLLVLTGHRGNREVHRNGAAHHQPEDDRQAVQIQLGPQAVHRHPCQVGVRQRGRPDHPQSPLAGQEAGECPEEVRRRRKDTRYTFCSVTVGPDPINLELVGVIMTDMSLRGRCAVVISICGKVRIWSSCRVNVLRFFFWWCWSFLLHVTFYALICGHTHYIDTTDDELSCSTRESRSWTLRLLITSAATSRPWWTVT